MRTLKDIDIAVGISEKLDGKINTFKFSNTGDKHGLIYGKSGSGRSTLIKYILGNLRSKYTKDELHIYFVEKKEEFKDNVFITKHQNSNDFRDTVIFYSHLKREIEKRLEKFKVTGATSYFDYNTVKSVLSTEEMLPRILILHDDFNMESDRIDKEYVEQVHEDLIYILTMGHVVGINIIMSPSSFKGIDEELESLFTLRMCLKCSEEIATKLSSSGIELNFEMKDFGECYVKSFTQEQELIKFQVPYLIN